VRRNCDKKSPLTEIRQGVHFCLTFKVVQRLLRLAKPLEAGPCRKHPKQASLQRIAAFERFERCRMDPIKAGFCSGPHDLGRDAGLVEGGQQPPRLFSGETHWTSPVKWYGDQVVTAALAHRLAAPLSSVSWVFLIGA